MPRKTYSNRCKLKAWKPESTMEYDGTIEEAVEYLFMLTDDDKANDLFEKLKVERRFREIKGLFFTEQPAGFPQPVLLFREQNGLVRRSPGLVGPGEDRRIVRRLAALTPEECYRHLLTWDWWTAADREQKEVTHD